MITELEIEGMTCGHCVAGVKSALECVPGVERVEVVISEARATVHGLPEIEALIEAVQVEGYGTRWA